ncbi:MAG: D-alanyl-D-alanine carboxypeptidase [Alphaproteobacteria bacterium]|nr:D-alanyl-D-alanine carboxypeptidase [Alphaproteobacteria bacterium]
MIKALKSLLALCAGLPLIFTPASAAELNPSLIVDVGNGAVLHEEGATRPWYPASLTKLMTVYVTLTAVNDRRLTLDTPLLVSQRAARMPPSKMGFKPGTEVTLENALKMLMVKSANDIAITIAEGVSGSVEDFAVEMNNAAKKLGMRDSHFVNPNGLHDAGHVSSARDMALVALALLKEFPEQRGLFNIGALKLDGQIISTHNGMLGRYPGADGMKTGFTCPAGFNVVVSATQNNRQLLAIILGSPNAKARSLKAMALLEAGFKTSVIGRPKVTSLPYLGPMAAPNRRPDICGRNRSQDSEEDFPIPIAASAHAPNGSDENHASFFAAGGAQMQHVQASSLLSGPRPAFIPVEVFTGRLPGWTGPSAGPRTPVKLAQSPSAEAKPKPAAKASKHTASKAKKAKAAKKTSSKAQTHKTHSPPSSKPKLRGSKD